MEEIYFFEDNQKLKKLRVFKVTARNRQAIYARGHVDDENGEIFRYNDSGRRVRKVWMIPMTKMDPCLAMI